MTFAQIQARVSKGVDRPDLADSYGDFVNEAIREIENRKSFSFTKKTTTVTVLSGTSTIALPADFKELQKRPAVHQVNTDGSLTPLDVVSEEEQLRRVWAFGGSPIFSYPPRAYTERNADGAVIGFVGTATEDIDLRVKYYCYLPDLEEDADVSPFFIYPMLVIAKAKAIAFSGINDAAASDFELEFEKKLGEAIRQDAYSEVAGRELRM